MILTNQCIMKLRAPGFAQVHKAAENGISTTNLTDVPPAEVRWAIPWQVHPSASHLCNTCLAALSNPHLSFGLYMFYLWMAKTVP